MSLKNLALIKLPRHIEEILYQVWSPNGIFYNFSGDSFHVCKCIWPISILIRCRTFAYKEYHPRWSYLLSLWLGGTSPSNLLRGAVCGCEVYFGKKVSTKMLWGYNASFIKNITLGEAICWVCDLEAPPQVTYLEELYVVVRFILERKFQPKCCEAIMLHCSKKPIRFIATCFLRMMPNDHNECLSSSISKFQLSLSETSPYKLPFQV